MDDEIFDFTKYLVRQGQAGAVRAESMIDLLVTVSKNWENEGKEQMVALAMTQSKRQRLAAIFALKKCPNTSNFSPKNLALIRSKTLKISFLVTVN